MDQRNEQCRGRGLTAKELEALKAGTSPATQLEAVQLCRRRIMRAVRQRPNDDVSFNTQAAQIRAEMDAIMELAGEADQCEASLRSRLRMEMHELNVVAAKAEQREACLRLYFGEPAGYPAPTPSEAVVAPPAEAEEFDDVNHPSHYCEGRSIEPRCVMDDWDLSRWLSFALGYIARIGRKGSEDDAIDDCNKAIAYLIFEEARRVDLRTARQAQEAQNQTKGA